MPTYVYECLKCGFRFEEFRSITDPPAQRCKKCHCKVRRIIMPGGGLIFKGTGFYETDYKRKSMPTENKKRQSSSKSKVESSKTSEKKTPKDGKDD